MYGTIARMRPTPGHTNEILKLAEIWEREHGPNVDGFVASYMFQPNGDSEEWRLVVIFEDRESYEANGKRPEQDRWFAEVRKHLQEDPVWEDGDVVYAMTGARPEPTI